MLNTVEAILHRRSVRAFLHEEVPELTLREIFTLAQQAPSNCNTQPWLVHLVAGAKAQALKQRLTAAAMDPAQHRPDFAFDGRYPGVYKDRQHVAAAKLYGAMGIGRDDRAARGQAMLRNFGFFDSPHAAFVFLPEPFGIREATDCGMYAQTLMLLLTARGLASCPQAALSFHPHIVREVLGVPESQKLLLGIAFGLEDKAAPANNCRVPRAALAEAVSFHR